MLFKALCGIINPATSNYLVLHVEGERNRVRGLTFRRNLMDHEIPQIVALLKMQ